MNFIKVTAVECNQRGTKSGQVTRKTLQLNADLIGAVQGTFIYLKGSKVIELGGQYFTDFQLANGSVLP